MPSSNELVPSMKTGSYRQWLIILLLGNGLLPLSYCAYVYEQGNFHAVSEDRVYRSRQLDEDELGDYIRTYKIRSVLNLRGENPGSHWYQGEIRVTQQLGVIHYDYGISSSRELGDPAIDHILGILRTAPKPILIHCQFGSDRSSLVAALYLYSIEGRTIEEASRQFSIRYGHFPYFGNSTEAMDRTFWRYVNLHPQAATDPLR